MNAASPYPSLLAPFTLAGRQLKNRVVHASMTTRHCANMRVTDRLIQYHANRARGGAALIVTEPLSMARHQNLPGKVRVWNDENIEGLERWAACCSGRFRTQDAAATRTGATSMRSARPCCRTTSAGPCRTR